MKVIKGQGIFKGFQDNTRKGFIRSETAKKTRLIIIAEFLRQIGQQDQQTAGIRLVRPISRRRTRLEHCHIFLRRGHGQTAEPVM